MRPRAALNEIDFFRELWLDTDGRLGRGCLIRTIGRRLGLKANEAMELGKRTAALGLIELNFASVSLSYAGWKLVTEAAKKQAAGEPPSQPTPERLLTAPKSPSLPRNCH